MDINQAARMIEWLDEERRRDKQLIATLEQRLVQQQELVETVQRRLNSVESDQTVIRSEVSTSSRETDVLDQVRKEMRQMIEGVESKRLSAERELERRSELARENMIRPFRELEERLEKLARQTGEMPVLQYEGERLNTQVAQIQQKVEDVIKKLDEPERRIAVLEEQQRLNTRRISETESEMPELKKQIESMRPKLTLLEDLTLRVERRVQEINSTDRERREQIQQFIDQQTLLLQQRDQQIESLVKKFDEHDHAMERNMERFETWSEAYRSMKTIIDDFQRIGDRLERRINEVAEMQRLSEERFRQEWNNWRSDDQKRWKQFTLSNDEVWRSHDKDFERFVKRMEELQEQLKPLHDSMTRLWRLERDRAQLYRERYTAMLAEYDIPSSSSGAAASTPAQPPAAPATSTSTGEMSIIKANGTPSSPTTP